MPVSDLPIELLHDTADILVAEGAMHAVLQFASACKAFAAIARKLYYKDAKIRPCNSQFPLSDIAHFFHSQDDAARAVRTLWLQANRTDPATGVARAVPFTVRAFLEVRCCCGRTPPHRSLLVSILTPCFPHRYAAHSPTTPAYP